MTESEAPGKDLSELGQAIRAALALDAAGALSPAIEAWEEIVSKEPALALAWARIGRLQTRRGDVEAALEAFGAAARRALGAAEPGAGLMARGWSVLRLQAAALRERASSLSGRIRRPLSSREMNPRMAAQLWLKSEQRRALGRFDEALASLKSIAQGFGAEDWPGPPPVEVLRSLSMQSEACQQAFAALSADRRLYQAFGAARLQLALVSGALVDRGRHAPYPALSEGLRWATLFIRGNEQVRGLFATDAPRPVLGTLVLGEGRLRLTDATDRPIAEVQDWASLGSWLCSAAVGWAAVEVADEIVRLLVDEAAA